MAHSHARHTISLYGFSFGNINSWFMKDAYLVADVCVMCCVLCYVVFCVVLCPVQAYGTMIFIRAGIVVESASVLKRAITVAIRYSAVRRQFGSQDGGKETKVRTVQLIYALLLCSLFCYLCEAIAATMITRQRNLYEARFAFRFLTIACSSIGCCRCWPPHTHCISPVASCSISTTKRKNIQQGSFDALAELHAQVQV